MSLCLLLWRQPFDHMVLHVITWLDTLCVCSLIYVIMLINVVIRFVSLWRNRRGQVCYVSRSCPESNHNGDLTDLIINRSVHCISSFLISYIRPVLILILSLQSLILK
jgi:hypothetical protein